MLEGTPGCGAEGAVAVAPGPCPAVPATLQSTRRDALARLSATVLAGVARPLAPDDETEASAAAWAWLDALDKRHYAASWTAAAPPLRDAIREGDWYTALRTVRAPLGRCLRRGLRTRALLDPPSGAPADPWVVLRFETHFERRQEVSETLAVQRSGDGRWRVAAYFVGESRPD
jgi:type IV secretory pathway VirJ component